MAADKRPCCQSKWKGKGNSSSSTAVTTTGLPLQVRNETIGYLGIQASPERPLTPDEQEFLDAVSKEVAEALEAARLFEQTQDALSEQERLTAELETVAQVSTVASTILESDALLQAVVDLSKTSFNLYHVHIYLLNETGRKLILKAGAGNVGRLMALEGREISIETDSLISRAARTRQGVMENNVRQNGRFSAPSLLPNTQAEMAVPMILGDKLIGVLDLQADKVDSFTAEDLKIQRTLASQIAIAIENARQYAEQVETSKKLREVDQLKSEFLASMSHELRTPLNSIIGFADVLLEGLDGDLNERMEEDVRLIRESGRHLRELIGDILDMSKIEAGRMELRYEDVDMRQMANDILATAQPLAQQKNLDMYLDIDDTVSTVRIDRTRIRQVLWNIMGNAIKFTEKGSVSLSMHNEGSHLLIAIRDTGIGIKEENIPIVFEQFRQIDGGLNRAASGTGLGMPITKKLVEIHGGDIWIESVYGQGSTFFFTLPYEAPIIKPATGPLSAY
ncbi:MAG: GAF domain-containing protein [Anaerolineae bacterium]|nr:GAF domain-containing protein [Anaerolineae bacterium]